MIHINVKKQLHSAEGDMLLDVNLAITKGTFTSIYGKSGAGKTTLLKILAGLATPNEGKIEVENNIWFDSNAAINVIPQKRNIGFVFQDYALFPNMTIRENLEFVMDTKCDKSRINEIIEIMELGDLGNRKPATLSGGQQQRVALARALARAPKILLLDEPLSALDFETRLKLQNEILKIHRHFNLTTIMISHDMTEIFKLSDFVIEMNNGEIIKNNTTNDVFKSQNVNNQIKLVGEIVEITFSEILILSGLNLYKFNKKSVSDSDFTIGKKVIISAYIDNLIEIE